jgi:hypothetical protein
MQKSILQFGAQLANGHPQKFFLLLAGLVLLSPVRVQNLIITVLL